MKRSSVYKILAVILSVLVATTLSVILFKNNAKRIFESRGKQDMKFYYEQTFELTSLEELEISWKSGEIEFVPVEAEEPQIEEGAESPPFAVKILERANREITDENHAFVSHQGDTLQIDWKKQKGLFSLFNFEFIQKNLQVEIPRYVYDKLQSIHCENISGSILLYDIWPKEISLESVSGNIEAHKTQSQKADFTTISGRISVKEITADSISLSSTSGKIVAEDIDVSDFHAENISGSIEADGAFKKAKAGTVSSAVTLSSSRTPHQIEAESIAGKISVYIPKDSQFTAKYESISGKFYTGFQGSYTDGEFVVGNGSSQFDFSTTSGAIEVNYWQQ